MLNVRYLTGIQSPADLDLRPVVVNVFLDELLQYYCLWFFARHARSRLQCPSISFRLFLDEAIRVSSLQLSQFL